MNDLSNFPHAYNLSHFERRARELRARAIADTGRKTWTRLTGLFRH